MPVYVSIGVAVLIFVLIWIAIGILPVPANLGPLRTVLYILDVVGLVLYLVRYV